MAGTRRKTFKSNVYTYTPPHENLDRKISIIVYIDMINSRRCISCTKNATKMHIPVRQKQAKHKKKLKNTSKK